MLSNPPLNYGPDLGAASADPGESENYEALLNLGKIKKKEEPNLRLSCLKLVFLKLDSSY